MRKSKFVAVLLAVVMVLAMGVSAFAVSSPSSEESPSGGTVTVKDDGKVTATDATTGASVPVKSTVLGKDTDTMKEVAEAETAEGLVDAAEDRIAAAVALAPQSAGFEDLAVAAALNLDVNASEAKPVKVSIPVAAAKEGGSVLVMQKTADGWQVVPAAITADGRVEATLTSKGDVVVMLAPATATAPVEDFKDTKAGAWYEEAMNFAVLSGIMQGTTGNELKPTDEVTRAEFVVMLHRLAGTPAATKAAAYTDIADVAWAKAAIDWGTEMGIVKGYLDGSVKGNQTISRQEMITMMARFAKFQGEDTTATETLANYTDKDQISSFAVDSVKWAVEEGIIKGTTTTTISPTSTALRAQAATVVYNYVK